jgi:hypothetical protein
LDVWFSNQATSTAQDSNAQTDGYTAAGLDWNIKKFLEGQKTAWVFLIAKVCADLIVKRANCQVQIKK